MEKTTEFHSAVQKSTKINEVIGFTAGVTITITGFEEQEIKELASKEELKLYPPGRLGSRYWLCKQVTDNICVVAQTEEYEVTNNYTPKQ